MTQTTAAIIGGGVIGGGWTARFLLMGWDVRVFDPDPQAQTKIGEVLDAARLALPSLYDTALPDEGRLSFHDTMSDAVAGAVWVQESVPERVELKRKVYRALQDNVDLSAIIASSTSGLTPTDLQIGAARPQAIIVAHPFVPVYLLPLVEVVGSAKNAPETLDRAHEILSTIGMYPLRVRHEIAAHIADRFLEAVWREALWLVNDGIATTGEIDQAIRMGFGLRWAQKGLFETYRIAGGPGGMRHFLNQFGPTLSLDWTKLMDTPEWTETLVDKIARQSDAQSGAKSVRDLEAERDANLVGILRALKAEGQAAGVHLVAQDRILTARNGLPTTFDQIPDIAQPILTVDRAVPTDWTDYNGHMNEAKYLQAFGDATDRLMVIVGCDAAYVASGGSYFTVETHIRHLDEVRAGAKITITTQVLDGEGKRMQLFHFMHSGDRLLATAEHMLLHVSLESRRASVPPGHIAMKLGAIAAAHAALAHPDGMGRAIGDAR